MDGDKADKRGSGGKRGGSHSKLSVSSPSSSPSRSPSLTKPMAAMSVASKGSGSSGSNGGSDSSEDNSRPSSGDETSPFPPDRADDGEMDSNGSGCQQDDRSATPDSAAGRQSSDVSTGTTDGGNSDGSSFEQPRAEQSSKSAMKVEEQTAMQMS